MLNTILASENPFRNVPVGEAALYAILGFAMVFIGIAFLIFVVWGVGKIMSAKSGTFAKPVKEKIEKKVEKVEKVKEDSLAIADASEGEITEETVAVITAAIMAYYQTNKPKCEFTVKRIKRI